MDIEGLPLGHIVDECRKQNHLFKKTGTSDTRYCYELFRRAFAHSNELAFNEVYLIYKPILEGWARKHLLIGKIDLEPQDCANIAFHKVNKALSGAHFDQKVPTLGAVIAFFKKTLNNLILEWYRRKNQGPPTDPLEDDGPETSTDGPESTGMYLKEIMDRVFELLTEDPDRRLFILAFVDEMTPKEIIAKYPNGPWENERHVTVRKHSIRKRLQGDDDLRRWAGIDDEE